MADETPKQFSTDHDLIILIDEKVHNIDAKISDLSEIKEAVLKLTFIQEKLQEDSAKRDREFIEYSANAERQWKKIAQNDIAFVKLSKDVEKLCENYKEHKEKEEEREKIDKQNTHDLQKTRLGAKWALVTAVAASLIAAVATIIAAFAG